jgi:hypothetical protein
MNITKDWVSINEARILLIGHDPRLQNSDTIANFVLFADYYFKEIKNVQSEKSKFNLAKLTFDHILYLTQFKYKPEDIYITNLCNIALDHAPRGKTVYIPKEKAEQGIENIKKILNNNASIEYVFPMSLQVNYWLQKLNFYSSNDNFVELTEPKEIGLKSKPQYFQPKNNSTFKMICGRTFSINDRTQKLIPILHTKNFPLRGKFHDAYSKNYEEIRLQF